MSGTIPMATSKAPVPPNSTSDKGKSKAVEGPGVEVVETVSLPSWLSPLMDVATEFYPPHLKV